MQVQFFKTRSELLKQFLEGYYFLSKPERGDIVYLTFPNNFVSVSVYRHTYISLSDNHAVISEDLKADFNSVLISNYKLPITVTYCGRVDEITLSFKPSGINSFLADFSSYSQNQLNKFIPFEDYQHAMASILDEPDIEKRILALENYWLSKLIKFENTLLDALIADISVEESYVSISKLAFKHHTSRQNVNKLFNRYVGKSPNDFKKINRFRFALSKKITAENQGKNLTSISYESLFYDQSHMIKEFKNLTGLTPSEFFKQINLKVGAGSWLFHS